MRVFVLRHLLTRVGARHFRADKVQGNTLITAVWKQKRKRPFPVIASKQPGDSQSLGINSNEAAAVAEIKAKYGRDAQDLNPAALKASRAISKPSVFSASPANVQLSLSPPTGIDCPAGHRRYGAKMMQERESFNIKDKENVLPPHSIMVSKDVFKPKLSKTPSHTISISFYST